MLHIVNKSPFTSSALEEAARFATAGSPILLIEDAVLTARAGTVFSPKLAQIMKTNPVSALDADLKARGVEKLAPGVSVVDYAGFVDLVAAHKPHSWL